MVPLCLQQLHFDHSLVGKGLSHFERFGDLDIILDKMEMKS